MKYSKPIRTAAAVAIGLLTLTSCGTEQEGSGYEPGTLGYDADKLGVQIVSNGWRLWSPSGDVNGEVGHPLTVNGPRGGHECNGGWNGDTGIASGQLPPGLSEDNNGDISGIPTERGHWIVTMKLQNIRCNGHRYTTSGLPDALVQYESTENAAYGASYRAMEECRENYLGYCQLTTIRFHITGTGAVH
jgi:hypothetical protein